LRYYAEHFLIVENDAAFYALPAQKQALLWAERTPDAFVMNFKTGVVFDYAPGSASPESSGTVKVLKAGKHKIK